MRATCHGSHQMDTHWHMDCYWFTLTLEYFIFIYHNYLPGQCTMLNIMGIKTSLHQWNTNWLYFSIIKQIVTIQEEISKRALNTTRYVNVLPRMTSIGFCSHLFTKLADLLYCCYVCARCLDEWSKYDRYDRYEYVKWVYSFHVVIRTNKNTTLWFPTYMFWHSGFFPRNAWVHVFVKDMLALFIQIYSANIYLNSVETLKARFKEDMNSRLIWLLNIIHFFFILVHVWDAL